MDQDAIARYITETFTGVDVMLGPPGIAEGDSFFIYDPDRDLTPDRKFPFATIVTKDYGDFDRASHLDRPGVFRLNIGIGKETFRALFSGETNHDFTTFDQLLPHPVYAAQSWVCILCPGQATFERAIRPLLTEAYELAVKRFTRAQS